jgi:Rha family phage regulatory protein
MTTLELVSELALSHGVPVVPSTVIAERFGKQHKHVLQSIRNLTKDLPDDFNEPNFRPVDYKDEKGEARPAFHLTRDAFSLLVMGFTGPEAMRWKLNFITAFNGLERLAAEAKQREHDEQLRIEARREVVADALTLTPVQYKVGRNILRYRAMGLEQWEITKLLGVSRDTVRRTLRKLGLKL